MGHAAPFLRAAVNPPVRPLKNPWPEFLARGAVIFRHADAAVVGQRRRRRWRCDSGQRLLDKPVARFMRKHAGAGITKAWNNIGKVAPLVLACAAAGRGRGRLRRFTYAKQGIISLEWVVGAAALSSATKNPLNRARPGDELGQWSRSPNRSDASFPSNHVTVAFATVTPFAQEYDTS